MKLETFGKKISDLNDLNFLKLPELYAELLIGGHTIELLNGDAGNIPEAWFSAICNYVCKRFNNLWVYMIRIIGLQSSGKSTLLNALFEYRFSVSVEHCTKGLFMRLLFLEEDLHNQLGIDAFIAIDIEGLGLLEKIESEKNDRILVTFAIGISNLTIINVLGESMRDLTEMLQIAIVMIARLEKDKIAPDIKMEALRITKEQDMEMGIFNAKCLKILDKRIKEENSILDDCKNLQRNFKFNEWYTIIQSYWGAVLHEDFAIHFKNIKEIYKFIGWSCDNKSNENSDLRSQFLLSIKELENILLYKIQRTTDCEECKKAFNEINKFEKYLKEENNQKLLMECKQTINNYIELNRQSASLKLVHIVEAGFLQKGYSSQFLNTINKTLENIRNTSNRKLSDEEIEQKITETWNLLRNNTLSEYPVKSVEDLIYLEWNSPIESEYKNGTLPDLHADRLAKLVLQKRDIDTIEERLDNLRDFIMGKSQHCYNGIVSDLKNKIEKTLSDFIITKTLPIFKCNAHIYGLLKFKQKLSEYQKKWDEENYPLYILDQKKEEYFNIIRTQLQHESILISEAYIIPWITRTETVRLKYFEELAIDVQNGNKENALNHFKNTKYHIENCKEIKRVYHDICNYKDYKEIELFVNNYMIQVDKIDYKCILGEPFLRLSEDKSIIKKLGCTESCYWYSALCWRSLGHHKNSDDSKIHYTSHQPRGFRGTKDQETGELIPMACHQIENNDGWAEYDVWYYGKKDLTKWGTAKDEDFSNCKFKSHYKKLFNDLMYWFFEKLHEDLANYYVSELASRDSLKYNGCLNLNYNNIISELREKLYPTLNITEYNIFQAIKSQFKLLKDLWKFLNQINNILIFINFFTKFHMGRISG
ncbi:8641_t:CDS:2 [Gigaspora rosea]|nr:8641_t:CDS:2 [Gigaspora rosea]